MTLAQKRVTLMALETEAKALEADLRERPPARDYWNNPLHVPDVRVLHLDTVRGALAAVSRAPTDNSTKG
jgi:hypothetical protein